MESSAYVRYDRHLRLSQIGIEGQKALQKAKVLVIGAGGLGATGIPYLAAAGIGVIGIVDNDAVELSNLQRQILFSQAAIGTLKVNVVKRHITALNEEVTVNTYPFQLTPENAEELFKQYNIIVDGTDNFATKYLINDTAFSTQKPYVFASIQQFEGQVSVFNYPISENDYSPNYRDVFPQPPDTATAPSCSEAGVLGVLPGIVGCCQANEVIKLICGIGTPLIGRLWRFDALQMTSAIYTYAKHPENPLYTSPKQLITADYYNSTNCAMGKQKNTRLIVTVEEFNSWRNQGKDFFLLDVRETDEYRKQNIGGTLIPLADLSENLTKIPHKKPIVILCHSGKRSEKACELLQQKNFENCYILKGGLVKFLATKAL